MVALHRSATRWELMYRLAWRVTHENRRLLEDAADPQVREAQQLAKAVGRDLHKMHAFVRFRLVVGEDGVSRYISWFEPDHLILERGARFFMRRFGSMDWVIATPDGTALWNQRELSFVSAPQREHLPRSDALEDLWRTYYRSICNAARINPAAMQREMPQKYWKLLPEAAEIGLLLRDSAQRVAAFDERAAREARERHQPIQSPGPVPVPGPTDDKALHECRRCDLWRHATQAVPGVGPADAQVMLVGEQPGDAEDLAGRPFVGPAGSVLDNALQAAGIDRATLYITNAVKHFKWEPRGKRRMHKTPAQQEVAACQHWLLQEIERVKPAVVVALGGTALRALADWQGSIDSARQQTLQSADGSRLVATYHPAAILRAPPAEQQRLLQALIDDLRLASEVRNPPSAPSAGDPANRH
jgi:DNA polymerase